MQQCHAHTFRSGETLVLRAAVTGYPRATPVRVVRGVGPAAAEVYMVEPLVVDGVTLEPQPSGVTLVLGIEALAEAQPLPK